MNGILSHREQKVFKSMVATQYKKKQPIHNTTKENFITLCKRNNNTLLICDSNISHHIPYRVSSSVFCTLSHESQPSARNVSGPACCADALNHRLLHIKGNLIIFVRKLWFRYVNISDYTHTYTSLSHTCLRT